MFLQWYNFFVYSKLEEQELLNIWTRVLVRMPNHSDSLEVWDNNGQVCQFLSSRLSKYMNGIKILRSGRLLCFTRASYWGQHFLLHCPEVPFLHLRFFYKEWACLGIIRFATDASRSPLSKLFSWKSSWYGHLPTQCSQNRL